MVFVPPPGTPEYVVEAMKRAAEATAPVEKAIEEDKALTWADEFIKDLLTEEEKYHDVLLDISSDAISDTMSKLKVYSDEFRAGADILAEQAFGQLGRAQGEALDDVYEEFFEGVIPIIPPPPGVDDEIDTSIFDIDRKTSLVFEETNARINELIGGIEDKQSGFWSDVQSWFGDRFNDLEGLFAPLTDIITEGVISLLSLALGFLFDRFRDFFFEEE